MKELKQEREEQVRFKPSRSKAPQEHAHERMTVYFSMGNVAKTTIVIIAVILLSQFLGNIANILLIFFIAILLASALNPTVDALQKKYNFPVKVFKVRNNKRPVHGKTKLETLRNVATSHAA